MRIPFSSFVAKMTSISTADPEKGLERPANGTMSPMPNRDPHVQEMLTQFRHYVGIHNDPDLANGRPVANLGLYQRVVKEELKYKKQFSMFSWTINCALGLQIIFAAALTALGAGNGPRSAITAFGALNTIIAGFLTYLKGSGLPNRFKYYKEEFTKVRQHIEQREREYSRGDFHMDTRAEVMQIQEMYDSVQREIELSTPEAFVSRTKDSTQNIDRMASHSRREYDDRMSALDDRINSTRRGLESRLSEARLGAESRYRDTRSGIDERMNSVRYGVESQLTQERLAAEARLGDAKQGAEAQYNTVRQGAESQYNTARQGVESQYNSARQGVENQYTSARQGAESQYMATRQGIENQYNSARVATAAQVEDTRHGLESRIEETRSGVASQVEETRHGMESRMKEVQAQVKEQEDKIMKMAESVAEKVLAVTQKRHEHDGR